ncbi:restriction endonuclease subunit S [Rhizobium sp. L1K21]|uniref:restriction endonuclease subunit S n=1 Tax=Rhizobium sp. L1K21 TaxID=2954933 RepID=UPI0020935BE5|nr:restriction endonuclease subunit S [Rhizobium sp. L1K21]
MSVRLGDVAEFIRGVTYKPADILAENAVNSIACLRTKNIQETLEDDDLVFIPQESIKDSKLLCEGDILVSSANSWNLVGKCCWIPNLGYQATFGGFTSVLRGDKSRIEKRYLYHWFSSPRIQQLARSFGNQTTNISNLNQNRCLELEIPLPPLDEQKRIAAILDKADQLRQKRRQAIALLDSLTQSVFLEMFGDPVSNPKGWKEGELLSDVAEIRSGITKGRATRGEDLRTVPYLAVANVQDKSLNLDTVKEIDATEDEIKRYKLEKDDLLVTEGGDPDKLGRGTLWNNELPEAIHQNHIFKIRFKDKRILPLFANWLIGSKRGKSYFLRSAKQTTGIASINKTQLSDFPMLIPPISIQLEFAEKAANVNSMLDKLNSLRIEQDNLFASLQHRAFSGQL